MPTSASAQRTPLPTAKTRDCTAPPTSPVSGSYPRMENVATGSNGGRSSARAPSAVSTTSARAAATRTARESEALTAIGNGLRERRDSLPTRARGSGGRDHSAPQLDEVRRGVLGGCDAAPPYFLMTINGLNFSS